MRHNSAGSQGATGLKKLIAALWILCMGTQAQAQELGPTGWAYQYMLARWQPGAELLPILDSLGADPGARTTATLDAVAELLASHAGSEQLTADDANAIVSLLARTRSGRYRDVMAASGDRLKIAKARAIALGYAAEHRRAKSAAYVAGGIDFPSLRQRYLADALAYRPGDAGARRLATLAAGSRPEDLFALAGTPHHVEVRQIKLSANTRYRRLLFYYRGQGRVVFAPHEKTGWLFQSVVADALAFEEQMPYRADPLASGQPDMATLRMIQLVSGSVLARKVAVESSIKSAPVPLEFLDAAAGYLSANFAAPSDEIEDDANAWIVRMLADHGGPRYTRLIRATRESSGSRIRRQAIQPIEQVEGVPRELFDAGSVSLPELAQKYPSLYPDVRFSSGRL
jgi:hypothetical protein